MYDQEVSGCRVNVLMTATLTIAITMVTMTREKMPVSASFFRIDIWTGQSMLIGMIMTVDVSVFH